MPLPSSLLPRVLQETKDVLGLTSSTDEAELLRLIEAAVRLVEYEVGPLQVLSATEGLSASGVLSRGPAVALTSASYLGVDYLATAVLHPSGLVTGLYTGTRVTYAYGHQTVPPEVRHVLSEMVRRAWRSTQQGFRPGYGDAPDEPGLPPALLLTQTDLAALKPSRFYSVGIA